MHRPDFDSQERVALSGALLGVAHAGHGETERRGHYRSPGASRCMTLLTCSPAHLLSGYNTNPSGEINVVAFKSAATTRMPWLVFGVNLTTFNSGLAYGPTALLHYEPHVGNLDPVEFVRAFDRGLRVRADLSGDFDIHAHWEIPVAELRERLGVDGHGDVRQPTH